MSSVVFKCPSGEFLDFEMNPIVFICVGSGSVSKLIQKASESIPNVPENKIATHVAIGGFDSEDNVCIWESHFATNGLKKKPFEGFLKQNQNSTIWAYQYPYIQLRITEALTELDLPYGTGDILTNKIASWNKDVANLRNDSIGLICSEALARSEPYRFIHDRVAMWNNGETPPPWFVHYQPM